MGIKPDRDANLTPPSSTPNDRYRDFNSGLEKDGARAGEVLKDINAKAESANTGATELAADLTALESRVTELEKTPAVSSISGNGWSARRQGKLVVLTLTNATKDLIADLPVGWAPAVNSYTPIIDFGASPSPVVRLAVSAAGKLQIFNAVGNCYGTITYFTA